MALELKTLSPKNSMTNHPLPEKKSGVPIPVALSALGSGEKSSDLSRYRQFFSDPKHKQENQALFRDFLKNVFMQLDEDKFFKLIDSILTDQTLNDDQIYQKLCDRIGEARHVEGKFQAINTVLAGLRSLKALKSEISDQVKTLMGSQKINGYIEIGYPGRMIRPLKRKLNMTGPSYVINDKESIADIAQCGFPRPYHKFLPLNDCAPIPKHEIAPESVDMVSMFIGLHHTETQKLQEFIDSIRRVLRPGGSFVLMDHDAKTPELIKLADMVHSVFNAATGVTLKEEKSEVRLFKGLDHWIALLKANGFELDTSHQPQIRKGDSTLNSVIRFVKIASKEEQEQVDIENTAKASKGYQRAQQQTYLTGPEWHNVRQAQGYGMFTKKDHFYNYPYFKEMMSAWNVYTNSWKAASRTSSFKEIAFSEYNMMNMFITTTTIMENLVKGLLSLPLHLLAQNWKMCALEKHYGEVFMTYAKNLEHTPCYDFPFFAEMKKVWKKLAESWNQPGESRIKNLLMALFITGEFLARGIIMAPLAWAYHQDGIKDPIRIGMIVKMPDNAKDYHNFFRDLNSKLKLKDNDNITVKRLKGKFVQIEVPRYLPFKQVVEECGQNEVTVIDVAGNKKIQLDILLKDGQEMPKLGDKGKVLYQTNDPSNIKQKYVAMDVFVEDMGELITQLKKKGYDIPLIHDY